MDLSFSEDRYHPYSIMIRCLIPSNFKPKETMIHVALNIWATGETKGTIPDYDRIFSLTMKELDRMFRPRLNKGKL
jgi:hypothetical protein